MPKPTRFLSAEWRWLAMFNYEVETRVLLPFVPTGTELDSWQGRTFVSLVAFLFLNTRVRGIAIPFHRNFEEVNLRFYVRRTHEGQVRRAVAFIKEIVPRRAIAWAARTLYNENYVSLPMDHRIDISEGAVAAEYRFRSNGRSGRVNLRTSGVPLLPIPGSQEEFITEHYWGYARQTDGGAMEYQVEHPQWKVWNAGDFKIEGDFPSLYGSVFGEVLQQCPSSAFLADGSAVAVYGGRRIT